MGTSQLTSQHRSSAAFIIPSPVLSWLNFTVTLSALAAGLLNFGDNVGRISAAMFSFVGECGTQTEGDSKRGAKWIAPATPRMAGEVQALILTRSFWVLPPHPAQPWPSWSMLWQHTTGVHLPSGIAARDPTMIDWVSVPGKSVWSALALIKSETRY